jgi:hypothetical protein
MAGGLAGLSPFGLVRINNGRHDPCVWYASAEMGKDVGGGLMCIGGVVVG